MKLLKKIFLLTIFTAILTMATHSANEEIETGKLWVAVAYGASEQGQSNELVAGLGVGGVLQAGLYGAAVGGPIGAGVGIVIGL
jgi:hypothetical protein